MADNYDQYGQGSDNNGGQGAQGTYSQGNYSQGTYSQGTYSQGNYSQGTYSQNNYYQDNTGNGPYMGQNPNNQEPSRGGKANALSIIGLVLGIVAIPACCCSWYNFVIAIPALICSIIGYRQTKSGVALGGIICAAIGLVLTIVFLVLYIIGLSMFGNVSPDELNSILESLEGYY